MPPTPVQARPGTSDAVAMRLDGLRVSFPTFQLGPLSIESRHGEVLAIVGPNGSGKTTMLRALCGLQPPTAGSVIIAGTAPTGRSDQLLERVAYIPDDHTELIADLTATELWELHKLAFARRGRDPEQLARSIDQLRHRFDFDPPKGTIGSYSHGMAKKTQLVAGLMHQPPVVIFDEPHNGLDPIAIRQLDRFIAELKQDSVGVILATHNLPYAETVADHVLLLRDGKQLAYGTPQAIAAQTNTTSLEEAFFAVLDDAR